MPLRGTCLKLPPSTVDPCLGRAGQCQEGSTRPGQHLLLVVEHVPVRVRHDAEVAVNLHASNDAALPRLLPARKLVYVPAVTNAHSRRLWLWAAGP
eukprot:CAMPEP_0197903120 /NCGR_PEP_ID=MMETSP1439-20131203/55163_1 /TAXON_ID=66791 /ORGANISM="Gonyaulax spinifera, Strain CCMP409" /LENGTH=95 /DNA_ID=CAMNT_0043524209 /DNA_START=351 /DNA_END=635 /DNA_ORIENTATION=+